jgi:aryl sulfotransferase
MAGIVWLASYPKSGNTWMRALLTNYRRDADGPAPINELEEGKNAAARVWFDEWVGVESSALPDEVVERLRPDVYRCLARDAQDTMFLKTHDAWRRTDRGEPLFPADVTEGVVYLVRNPLDLAASYADHQGVEVARAVELLCDPENAMSRQEGLLVEQLTQPLRSWSGHIRTWLDDSGLRVHLARYEDLLADPEGVFRAVLRFCGLPPDEDRIRKAVRFSQFSELQRQEREKGFRERAPTSTAPFFRGGRAGSWREELSPELARRLIAAHSDAMRRFGYLDGQGRPV